MMLGSSSHEYVLYKLISNTLKNVPLSKRVQYTRGIKNKSCLTTKLAR